MSTTETTKINVNELAIQQDASGSSFVQVADGFRLEQVVISRDGSVLKGLNYWRPQVESIGRAVELFGEDTVVAMLNAKLSQSTFAAAKAKLQGRLNLPETATAADETAAIDKLKQEDPCIFSRENAYEFRPGERELSAQQITRELAKTMKEVQTFLAEGKVLDAQKSLQKIQLLQVQFNKAAEEMAKQVENA